MTIIAVTGLAREARIARGPDVIPVIGGGNAQALRERLERAISPTTQGLVSFGIAGALAPELRAGNVVVASAVMAGNERFATDEAWTRTLLNSLEGAATGPVAAGGEILAQPADKQGLYRASGALSIDMESHVAARAAHARRLPFAVLRVVSDAADEVLPPAALVAMTPGGRINFAQVALSVLRRPRQIPDLMRTARDSRSAFAALLRCRDVLGLGFALPDFA